jgi:hypothetical protein
MSTTELIKVKQKHKRKEENKQGIDHSWNNNFRTMQHGSSSKHSSGNVGLNQKQVVLKSSAPKKIAKIQFATMDYKEMALCSELQVLHI